MRTLPSLSSALLVPTLILSLSLLSACGKDSASDTEKQASPAASSGQNQNPNQALVNAIRNAKISRVEKTAVKFSLSADLILEVEGKLMTFVFRTQELSNDSRSNYLDSSWATKRCEDSRCTKFVPETESPISVDIRCTTQDCRSSLAVIRGANGHFVDKTALLEHQLLDKLPLRSIGRVFITSPNLEKLADAISENSLEISGEIEINRVIDSPLQSISVFATASPNWLHNVFRGKARPDTDITKLPEYFIRTVGAAISREADGKTVTQRLVNFESHPNSLYHFGSTSPCRVRLQWKSAVGQITMHLQDPTKDGGGTLVIGFTSEKLLKPALDEHTSESSEPSWLF